jgi:arylsulfatase A-like enzyme/Tfp pilus assembly protein PilF
MRDAEAQRPNAEGRMPKAGARKRPAREGGQASAGPPRVRQRTLGIILFASVLLLAVSLWLVYQKPVTFLRNADQNVLLVTIDTLRADALGCYGGAAGTPTLDALARRGVRYDFAHSHAVVTLPSHASILTGLYPFQHGIRDNNGYRLRPDTTTLAGALKQAGFATAAFVGAFPLDARFGLPAGFDVYDDAYPDSGRSGEFEMPERRGEEVVALARTWITAQRGKWFAWVHVFDPHATYLPPAPFDSQYASNPYLGEVAYTDRALSSLLADLPRQSRPTLTIVTADHGEGLGDHGEETHGLFAYEATLRVPLIIATVEAPASENAQSFEAGATWKGEVSPTAARHVDLVPTILDLVRAQVPNGLPGRSLVSAGGRATDDGERTSYFEAMSASLNRGWAPLTGVFAAREKLISLPLPELYDLSTDAHEERNLIDEKVDRRRALEARLAAFGSTSPGPRAAESTEALNRLRALGYVSGTAAVKTRYDEADDPKRMIDLDQAIHQGVELYQHRRIAEAEQVFERILAKRPDMTHAYRHLAAVRWESGRPAEAIATLERGMKVGASDAVLQAQLGIYLAEAGRPTVAIPFLEAITVGTTPDIDAVNALGIAYGRAGRLDRAVAAFERVSTLDPTNAMAYENIGSTRLRQGDADAARAALERAAALNPRSARAQLGLGAVEMHEGNREAAFAHWRRAAELDPSELEALYNLATGLAAAGRPTEARPYAEAFLKQAPPALFEREIAELRRFAR